ncbi:MAG: hypothetical protein AAFR12_02845 [Cyanobacteria bacterium J06626_6]
MWNTTILRRRQAMGDKALKIQLILVPAGAEYWAVRLGLNRVKNSVSSLPHVVAIPAGPSGVKAFLETGALDNLLQKDGILLVGLGGGLSARCGAGDVLVLNRIWNALDASEGRASDCDPALTRQIAEQLGALVGAGVTCDRVITTAAEKEALGDRFSADVVDMESVGLVDALARSNSSRVAVVRVISDDAKSTLPNLSVAIGEKGELRPRDIAMSFLSHPFAAVRLIRSSLKGLMGLSSAISRLFCV